MPTLRSSGSTTPPTPAARAIRRIAQVPRVLGGVEEEHPASVAPTAHRAPRIGRTRRRDRALMVGRPAGDRGSRGRSRRRGRRAGVRAGRLKCAARASRAGARPRTPARSAPRRRSRRTRRATGRLFAGVPSVRTIARLDAPLMGKILHRYVFREILVPFALGLGVFTFVLLLARLLKLIELVVNRGIPATHVSGSSVPAARVPRSHGPDGCCSRSWSPSAVSRPTRRSRRSGAPA